MESESRLRLIRDAVLAPAEALRPVSLALICQSYPPVVGGSEIEAQRVCAGLLNRGHQVEVICEGAPPMPPLKRWKDPLGDFWLHYRGVFNHIRVNLAQRLLVLFQLGIG